VFCLSEKGRKKGSVPPGFDLLGKRGGKWGGLFPKKKRKKGRRLFFQRFWGAGVPLLGKGKKTPAALTVMLPKRRKGEEKGVHELRLWETSPLKRGGIFQKSISLAERKKETITIPALKAPRLFRGKKKGEKRGGGNHIFLEVKKKGCPPTCNRRRG